MEQLKSCLIEEWEQFQQQSVINEAVKQWHQHTAFEHAENISNSNFRQACCLIFFKGTI